MEKSSSGPPACDICSQFDDQESASQKFGWEEMDTFLPAASHALKLVRDLKPNDVRALQLWQCPKCNTCYRYESDYDYLVNGSEDHQSLIRLDLEEAKKYLNLPI